MILFSKSTFIHHTLPHEKHDTGWGYITGFTSLAYLIGPNIAVALAVNQKLPLIVAFVLQLIALIAALVFRFVFKKLIKQPLVPGNHHPTPLQGIKLWGVLNERLWPILLFMFCLLLLDATFWTVGAILVNEMSATYRFAGLLYVVYLLPTMIFPPVGLYLSKRFGKKRTAFISGIAGGIVIALSFLAPTYPTFLVFIGISSILLSAGFPEIHGAIEDYCERLGTHANALVGLTNSMGSLAYIIGPILAGAIAVKVGTQHTFAIIGVILALCSLIALIVVPRKIKLPQLKLQHTYE
jgi:MFS family permease